MLRARCLPAESTSGRTCSAPGGRPAGSGGCRERETGGVPGRRGPDGQRRAQGSGPGGEVRLPGETSPVGSCLQGETKGKTNPEIPRFSFLCMRFCGLAPKLNHFSRCRGFLKEGYTWPAPPGFLCSTLYIFKSSHPFSSWCFFVSQIPHAPHHVSMSLSTPRIYMSS